MIRALICDIYGTLLRVAPPENPPSWEMAWAASFGTSPTLTEAEFSARCLSEVAAVHSASLKAGVDFPEVDWLEILQSVIGPQPRETLRHFAREAAFRQRKCTLMPGAAAVLEWAACSGLICGLCSNAQDYTLAELAATVALETFDPDISFLSFQHGFSKPGARVFQLLGGRLAARGLQPEEILMIGDRPDNDILPAASSGWQTWLLTADSGSGPQEGGWPQLMEWLRSENRSIPTA